MVHGYSKVHGWDGDRLARVWFRVRILCGDWASSECDLGHGVVYGLGPTDWVVG